MQAQNTFLSGRSARKPTPNEQNSQGSVLGAKVSPRYLRISSHRHHLGVQSSLRVSRLLKQSDYLTSLFASTYLHAPHLVVGQTLHHRRPFTFEFIVADQRD